MADEQSPVFLLEPFGAKGNLISLPEVTLAGIDDMFATLTKDGNSEESMELLLRLISGSEKILYNPTVRPHLSRYGHVDKTTGRELSHSIGADILGHESLVNIGVSHSGLTQEGLEVPRFHIGFRKLTPQGYKKLLYKEPLHIPSKDMYLPFKSPLDGTTTYEVDFSLDRLEDGLTYRGMPIGVNEKFVDWTEQHIFDAAQASI